MQTGKQPAQRPSTKAGAKVVATNLAELGGAKAIAEKEAAASTRKPVAAPAERDEEQQVEEPAEEEPEQLKAATIKDSQFAATRYRSSRRLANLTSAAGMGYWTATFRISNPPQHRRAARKQLWRQGPRAARPDDHEEEVRAAMAFPSASFTARPSSISCGRISGLLRPSSPARPPGAP